MRCVALAAVSAFLANCSNPPRTAMKGGIDPRYGVAPSRRVIEDDGTPVPKGGGRELVGKPYVIAGRTYVPRDNAAGYRREGLASWYGAAFHGRLTANGEVFDRHAIAAAHPTLPLPSYARVTNLRNKRSIIVRVNDRGPYHANRVMDVSQRVADALDFRREGTALVRVEYVGRASTRGSDDNKLLATLRTDGLPALIPGSQPIMVADAGFASPFRPRPEASPPALAEGSAEEAAEPATRATPVIAAAPVVVAAAQAVPVPPQRPATTVTPTPEEEEEEEASEPIQLAGKVPLPPERPFDLGTIPNAGTPVPPARSAAAVPPRRPVYAGLLYAPVQAPSQAPQAGPFALLKPQPVLAMRRTP